MLLNRLTHRLGNCAQANVFSTGVLVFNFNIIHKHNMAVDRISMAEDTKLEVKQAQRAKS